MPPASAVETKCQEFEIVAMPPVGQSTEENRRAVREIREFLWTHWRDKKVGCAEVSSVSIEGESTRNTVYIEHNGERDWQITVVLDREQHVLGGLRVPQADEPHHQVNVFTFATIQRFSADNRSVRLMDDDERPSSGYVVVLKGGRSPGYFR